MKRWFEWSVTVKDEHGTQVSECGKDMQAALAWLVQALVEHKVVTDVAAGWRKVEEIDRSYGSWGHWHPDFRIDFERKLVRG